MNPTRVLLPLPSSGGRPRRASVIGLGALAVASALLPGPASADALPENMCRIHYHRPDAAYDGFGLHVWEGTTESVTWASPLPPAGRDDFGVYWDVRLQENAERIGFIIHRGEEKDPGPDQFLAPARDGREVWIVSGRTELNTSPPDVAALARGDLGRALAHWVDARTLLWDVRVPSGGSVRLYSAARGGLKLTRDGVTGADASVTLAPARAGMTPETRERFPHLTGLRAFAVPEADLPRIPSMVRGQLGIAVHDADGGLVTANGLQIPGVLDDRFATDAPLGVTWKDGVPSLAVWAPTAHSVKLHLFDGPRGDAGARTVPMTEADGVWSVAGRADWKNLYYQYEVEVWVPSTRRVETNRVTDPYSRSLARNSRRSQIVDLADPALTPPGWNDFRKPPLAGPQDVVLYELHIRDFSASAPDVPEAQRGTYLAFAGDNTGTRHLRSLADAGLTHVHLLPAFDIATVNEDRSAWADPGDLTVFPPDSETQQERVNAIRERDGFNWGYDPFHYGVPEGSYATDPDGGARLREFRTMVQALSGLGLRTVMDVVYNHTNASGQSDKSVLDRIVPGYYHRLNAAGAVETSTCCQNTATEHAMMERLMIDDLVHWAVDYRIDGFRFDLMGHHLKRNLEAVRARLDALRPERDGVDGRSIILYGEGWDFGELQGGKRGVNAAQGPMAGTGIGTFNDRIRDAVRGGNPFGDRREQGFATGLFVMPSAFSRSRGTPRGEDALAQMDRVRAGLAGGLRDYRFPGRSGAETRGADGGNGGYTASPLESINYVSAHDNETLFDKVQFAAPESADIGTRTRMHWIALDVVALGQGIPFFHAGSEFLRSKSMDRDSYDSGDWFNRLDFAGETNNFAVGLPIADKNAERWNVIRPLLADPALRPGPELIRATADHFRTMLAIRSGSPLFRLTTAEAVQRHVRFLNTGPAQVAGLIVMQVGDPAERVDPDVVSYVVVFNATDADNEFRRPEWRGREFLLHPRLAVGGDPAVRGASFDADTGEIRVPAWTTAVFLEKSGEAR